MPELPEVEVTRLSFGHRIAGAEVLGASLGKTLRWPLGCACDQLVGRLVVGVRRRGKYLLVDLDDGLLLVHLGMSGSLSFARDLPPVGIHDHFELMTSRGTLRLNDPRRFGAVVFAKSEGSPEAQKLLGKLGMEPLERSVRPQAILKISSSCDGRLSSKYCCRVRWWWVLATSTHPRRCLWPESDPQRWLGV